MPKRKSDRGASAPAWRAGYGECDITPKPGQSFMAGYGYERYATGTLAPLMGQALAIADRRGKTAVLIAADLLGFDRTTVEAIRRAVESEHGLPHDRVMLCASHTHWAPAVSYGICAGLGAPNPWYMRFLEESLLDTVDRAIGGLQPASIGYGALNTRIGMNRRNIDRDGKNRRHGPYATGFYDEHTPVLRIRRRRSPRDVVLIGHACHPTDSGNISKWWPAYPGAMRETIEKKLGPDSRALFVMGCGGDAKVVFRNTGTGRPEFAAHPTRSRAAGRKLARAVLSHLDGEELTALDGPLVCTLASGGLTYAKARSRLQLERMAYDGTDETYRSFWARQALAYPFQQRKQRFDIQAWRIGNQLTLFGLEGEPCSPLGPLTRSLARTETALTIGYANALTGYIPTKEIVREGGYEGDTAHMAYFLPAPFTPDVEREYLAIARRAVRQLTAG